MGQIKIPAGASAPPTPSAGQLAIYAKNDGLLYYKNDAGTEVALTGGGGGGVEYVWQRSWAGAYSPGQPEQFFASGTTSGFVMNDGVPIGDNDIETIRHLFINVTFNSIAAPTDITVYLDGVATGITIQVGAGATGSFSETATSLGITPSSGNSRVMLVASAPPGAGTLVLSATLLFDTQGGM